MAVVDPGGRARRPPPCRPPWGTRSRSASGSPACWSPPLPPLLSPQLRPEEAPLLPLRHFYRMSSLPFNFSHQQCRWRSEGVWYVKLSYQHADRLAVRKYYSIALLLLLLFFFLKGNSFCFLGEKMCTVHAAVGAHTVH